MPIVQLAMHNVGSKEKRIWFQFQIRFVLKPASECARIAFKPLGSLSYPLTAKRNPSAF